jgi:hypothetical protein
MAYPYSFIENIINENQCIGDSLPTINNNYVNLDTGLAAVSTTNIDLTNKYNSLVDVALSGILTFTDLTATNIFIANNGSLIGTTSATSIGIGSLSARTFTLVHDPANDGVDPILDIGETLTGSFSGFRIRYEEPTNRLIGSGRTGTTILTSFMINTATGQIGISGLPAAGQALTVNGSLSASAITSQALTVVGNISATGVISSQFGIPVSVAVPIDFRVAATTIYPIFTVPANRIFTSNGLLGFVIERSEAAVGTTVATLTASGAPTVRLSASNNATLVNVLSVSPGGTTPYSGTTNLNAPLSAGYYWYKGNQPGSISNLNSFARGGDTVVLFFEAQGYTAYTSLTGRAIVSGTIY